MKKSKYFKSHELVSKYVYNSFSEEMIMNRMNSDLIRLLDWVRELAGVPIIINNWKSGGSFSQRGYRCNLDPLIKDRTNANKVSFSAHGLFMAADMSPSGSSGKSSEWLYERIKANASKAPCDFRMENKKACVNSAGVVTWVHVDVAIPDTNPIGSKVVKIFMP